LAFPVLPFLAGTVELFSSFYSKQQLSHFYVKYSPTVRRTDSSAFTLFNDVCALAGEETASHYYPQFWAPKYGSWYFLDRTWPFSPPTDRLHALMQQLPARLNILFQSDEAAPNQQDEFGNTLLFVSLSSLQ
jgi:hypothetical protein